MRFLKALAHGSEAEYGMIWSFDGASRGNPGPASYGVCAWWGTWGPDGFHPEGSIFERGTQIGTTGNNIAEGGGLAAACKAAVRYLTWFLEQTSSRASRHPL